MAHLKIFEGDNILVNRLKTLLQDEGISSITKDPIESGRLAGFGTMNNIVSIFVKEEDKEKATLIVENFKKAISE